LSLMESWVFNLEVVDSCLKFLRLEIFKSISIIARERYLRKLLSIGRSSRTLARKKFLSIILGSLVIELANKPESLLHETVNDVAQLLHILVGDFRQNKLNSNALKINIQSTLRILYQNFPQVEPIINF